MLVVLDGFPLTAMARLFPLDRAHAHAHVRAHDHVLRVGIKSGTVTAGESSLVP